MMETVVSPVSMRSSSGWSSDRDCEPISAANSLCAKLKAPLARLNLDASPIVTNQVPNPLCSASGQVNDLV